LGWFTAIPFEFELLLPVSFFILDRRGEPARGDFFFFSSFLINSMGSLVSGRFLINDFEN
jgi:hypothetical protein